MKNSIKSKMAIRKICVKCGSQFDGFGVKNFFFVKKRKETYGVRYLMLYEFNFFIDFFSVTIKIALK